MEGMGVLSVRSETGSRCNDDVDDRLDREWDGVGGQLEVSEPESSPESFTDGVDCRARSEGASRFPLRWRAECRAFARHLAVARAHSLCLALASLSF